ncbi:MAG: Ribosomal RNA small subunit methyltransferase B [Syntrophorhabdus sp. PtaU1.Bin050]|nr:MAG: Ribosomal RNA small subunit methyltransferase B [Syntrophorhabdus sp. PtaU1.Bin050]
MKKGSGDWRIWLIDDNFWYTLRSSTVAIIDRVEAGHFLDETLNLFFSAEGLSPLQKGLIHEITSGAIRWKGYFDWVLSRYTKTDTKKHIRYLLWVSLYQVAFMRKAGYHVVKEAVEYAKKTHGQKTAGFVNAILRRFMRDVESGSIARPGVAHPGQAATLHTLSTLYSFPEWLVTRWLKRFGPSETEKLLSALNRPPVFALRIDLKRIRRDEVIRVLEAKGVNVSPGAFLESALHVDKLAPVLDDALFREKLVHIQDEASQLAGISLQPGPGDLVLDACAGLGTKTEQIAEISDRLRLVAMDNSLTRLRLISHPFHPVLADALAPPFKDGAFDAILLDAPCSSFGIIRKHPELKWRRKGEDIRHFGTRQLTMLKALWDRLKTGGHLVYSVCSFEPEETVDVIEGFGKERKFVLENPFPFLFNRDCFVSLPHESNMDGFFIARLRKL